jgi:hypothetical protein
MTKCEDKRPKNHKGEEKVTTVVWDVAKIPAEMRAVMVAYAGCIEGPRLSYQAIGDDRNVLAAGTAEQIARYSVGEEVSIGGKSYQRNVGRKQEDTAGRLKDEMKGTGEFAGKGHNGYTITVNGQLVSADSVLNGYFVEKDAADKEGKPILDKEQRPIRYMGGVEMIVSAIIKPGLE